MKYFTTPFVAGILGTIAALGVAVTTTPKAEAGGGTGTTTAAAVLLSTVGITTALVLVITTTVLATTDAVQLLDLMEPALVVSMVVAGASVIEMTSGSLMPLG